MYAVDSFLTGFDSSIPRLVSSMYEVCLYQCEDLSVSVSCTLLPTTVRLPSCITHSCILYQTNSYHVANRHVTTTHQSRIRPCLACSLLCFKRINAASIRINAELNRINPELECINAEQGYQKIDTYSKSGTDLYYLRTL